jgi:CheY-like chemotaxis protein
MSPVQHFDPDPKPQAVDDRPRRKKPPNQTRELPVPVSTTGKPVVMVLDDDWATCDAFKEVLEEAGFDTVCLANGELGLDHLAEHPAPTAIILDLMMPVMDGWTFVSRLRALPHLEDIPILVATAAGPHWGYPTSPVLRKPVGRNELILAVTKLVDAKLRRTSGT